MTSSVKSTFAADIFIKISSVESLKLLTFDETKRKLLRCLPDSTDNLLTFNETKRKLLRCLPDPTDNLLTFVETRRKLLRCLPDATDNLLISIKLNENSYAVCQIPQIIC